MSSAPGHPSNLGFRVTLTRARMKAMTVQGARVRGDLERLATRGLEIPAYFEEAGRLLGRAVPHDGFCSMTVDPATMLLTSHIAHNSVRPEDVPGLGRNEFLEEDVNKFAVLARSERPSGVLTEATDGEPGTSSRFRQILTPNGITDELRFVLLDAGVCWGWIAVYRREGSAFRPEEAQFAASVSRPLAAGLRRSILLSCAVSDDGSSAPGLVLLDRNGSVEAMSSHTQQLLGSLLSSDTGPGGLPAVVHSVAYRARLAAHGDRDGARDGPRDGARDGARARVPTASGTWLTLHGSLVGDPEDGRTAVILERSQPPEIAPVIVAAYGLTARERDVVQQVLLGLTGAEAAAALHITEYTLQDHLKSVFDKVGVRSRRELVAQIFFQNYVPRLQAGTAIGPTGWFRDQG